MILILLTEEFTYCSSKPIPRWTAVRVEGGGFLTEASEVKAGWAGYFERLYLADPPAVEVDVRGVTTPILTLQSAFIHLPLWKHRLR